MHGTILPRIPGRDFAGVVTRGPADLLGREVWGTGGDISRTRDGTHAEFILLPRAAVTLKPASLAMEAAAAAGLSYITAWEAIVTTAALAPGETAVIFGRVGRRCWRCRHPDRQIPGSPRHRDCPFRCRHSLRPRRMVPTKSLIPAPQTSPMLVSPPSPAAARADVSFDASGMMFSEAVEAAAPDGRLPIVAASPDGTATFNLRSLYRKMLHVHGIDTLRLDAIVCAKRLAQLTPGFDSGQFKVKPARPMPLAAAAEAYEPAAHGGGRIILQPAI